MNENKIKSFKEFWPFYLGEHSKSATKLVHFLGTTFGLLLLVIMFTTQLWWIFPVGLVLVYGPLFLSHFLIEKNKPATFKYPFWSILADLKMWFFILTGKIKL